MGFLDNAGLGTLWKNIVGKSIPYGYCTTGASTRAKTVTVSPAITELTAGVQILVKFQYANTASTTSSPVTLNVNGLGAKDIKRYGSTNISNSATTSWNANSVVLLTYDGTYWQLTDYNNTTYSGMTDAEVNAGTSGTNRLITPARLKYAIQHWSTGEANVQSDWGQTDSTADDFIKNKPTIPSGVSPYTSNPSMDGTASAGSSDLYARGDHVHPTDTSRAAASHKHYAADVNIAVPIGQQERTVQSWITSTETDMESIWETLDDKVDSEAGKGLSTNDYTTEEKTKLAGIASGAERNIQSDWDESNSGSDAYIQNKPTIPTKTSDLTNDSGFITTETDPTVPSWAKASTKPSYTASEVGAQPTLVSGTNIKTINGNSILGSGNLVISGGGSEPTMQTLSVTSGGSGTWHYRIWPSGWQEAWYQGSIKFTAAATSAGGWYRSTKNFALPISFADSASILVSGATSGRVYTNGGIKTNGTQFEAQILGGASLAANTYAGWSVYVAGYGRS